MSNTSQSQSQSRNRPSKGGRLFRCTKCSLSFFHQGAYHEHLRNHVPTFTNSVNDSTSVNSVAEDTARYIAERRKNYPTVDNVNKKMKSDEERQERGDVLQTRQFGRMKERKTIPNSNMEGESIAPVHTTTINNNTHVSATLLERLLAPDIRRERNMVLQCIRHIVNNEFFGLDTN